MGKPDAGNPPVRFDEGEGYASLLYRLCVSSLKRRRTLAREFTDNLIHIAVDITPETKVENRPK